MSIARNLSRLAAFLSSTGQTQTAGIADGAITTPKIADGAVITQDIANNAVTPAKMANAGAEFGMRNRIINGAMMIDQRNAGAAQTANGYNLDRWNLFASVGTAITIQQNYGSVTPPAGFTNYLGAFVASSQTVGTNGNYPLIQAIEGLNLADMAWGTASASPITLSFWVRSSLTGTFGGSLRNASVNRAYVFSYTINAANTWEYKTITIAGDTSGTWLTTNGVGVYLTFSLGAGTNLQAASGSWGAGAFTAPTGAVSLVATAGATLHITGVQLEKGSTATPFDFRSYGQELALCQRYLYSANNVVSGSNYQPLASGVVVSATSNGAVFQFPQVMRATPSVTSSGALRLTDMVNWSVAISSLDAAYIGASSGLLLCNTVSNVITSSGAAGKGLYLGADGATVRILFSAEL